MNDLQKSDCCEVAMKPANKPDGVGAEPVERRRQAEGNTSETHTRRTQSRVSVSPGLDRVRERAKAKKKERFTALLHLIDVDRLRAAYFALKRDASPGIDGVSWEQYGQDLDSKLVDLHGRIHRGAYRALPSKRQYIPKSDGQKRPLGIAALEDKVAQRAAVEVLNAIYETDFLGFSYGFRPGRSQHDALDALAAGITTMKVNWIVDADIKSFLDPSSHYTSICGSRAEEIGKSRRYLDSQAFSSSAADVQGVKFAALYTLQDGLARDAEQMSGFEHRHVTVGHTLHEARTQFLSEPDAPRRTRRDLFCGDKAIVEPAMQGRGRDAERLRRAFYRHALSLARLLSWFEAGDVPVRAQTADAIGSERQPRRRSASLAIENAGDERIGVMHRQATQQLDGVLRGADRCGVRARQGNIDLAQESATPA